MMRVPLSSTSILFTAASHRATLFCTVRITAVPWRVAAATSPSGPAARSRLWQLMKRTLTSRISAMFVSRPASSFGHTALGMYHPMSSFSSRFITSRAGGRGTESASTSRLSMIIKSPSGLLPSSFTPGGPRPAPAGASTPPSTHVSPEAANGSATASCAMGSPAAQTPLRLEAAVDADGGADAAEVEGGEHAATHTDVEREAVHLGGALLVRHPAVELLVEAARARRRHLRRHALVGEGPRLGARAVHAEDDEERVAGELDHVAGSWR